MVLKPRKYKLECPFLYIDNFNYHVYTDKYLRVIISHDLNDIDMKQLRANVSSCGQVGR